jgi:hypothetical protein
VDPPESPARHALHPKPRQFDVELTDPVGLVAVPRLADGLRPGARVRKGSPIRGDKL